MAFTAPTGPVIDEPIRPRAFWYWIGGGLIVLAVPAAIVWGVLGFLRIDDEVDDFERVRFPEGGTIVIDDPGDFVVYSEGSLAPLSDSGVTITGPDGDDVGTSPYSGSLTYDFGGRSGTAQQTFTADEAGEYVITPRGVDTGQTWTYAIGPSVARGIVGAIVGAFVIGGLGVLVGAIVLLVTGVRRSRAKQARRPPVASPSAWGSAPPSGRPPPSWNPPSGGVAPPPSPGPPPPPPPGWPPDDPTQSR
jgi:hypothetical protein